MNLLFCFLLGDFGSIPTAAYQLYNTFWKSVNLSYDLDVTVEYIIMITDGVLTIQRIQSTQIRFFKVFSSTSTIMCFIIIFLNIMHVFN